MSCCIYVIGAKVGAVKIGVANNAKKRLVALQYASPTKLEILYCIRVPSREIAYGVENAAHRTLKARRTHGEWFAVPVNTAVEAIRAACPTFRLVSDHRALFRHVCRRTQDDTERARAWALRSARRLRHRA